MVNDNLKLESKFSSYGKKHFFSSINVQSMFSFKTNVSSGLLALQVATASRGRARRRQENNCQPLSCANNELKILSLFYLVLQI